jgi:hypothetical protein
LLCLVPTQIWCISILFILYYSFIFFSSSFSLF